MHLSSPMGKTPDQLPDPRGTRGYFSATGYGWLWRTTTQQFTQLATPATITE